MDGVEVGVGGCHPQRAVADGAGGVEVHLDLVGEGEGLAGLDRRLLDGQQAVLADVLARAVGALKGALDVLGLGGSDRVGGDVLRRDLGGAGVGDGHLVGDGVAGRDEAAVGGVLLEDDPHLRVVADDVDVVGALVERVCAEAGLAGREGRVVGDLAHLAGVDGDLEGHGLGLAGRDVAEVGGDALDGLAVGVLLGLAVGRDGACDVGRAVGDDVVQGDATDGARAAVLGGDGVGDGVGAGDGGAVSGVLCHGDDERVGRVAHGVDDGVRGHLQGVRRRLGLVDAHGRRVGDGGAGLGVVRDLDRHGEGAGLACREVERQRGGVAVVLREAARHALDRGVRRCRVIDGDALGVHGGAVGDGDVVGDGAARVDLGAVCGVGDLGDGDAVGRVGDGVVERVGLAVELVGRGAHAIVGDVGHLGADLGALDLDGVRHGRGLAGSEPVDDGRGRGGAGLHGVGGCLGSVALRAALELVGADDVLADGAEVVIDGDVRRVGLAVVGDGHLVGDRVAVADGLALVVGGLGALEVRLADDVVGAVGLVSEVVAVDDGAGGGAVARLVGDVRVVRGVVVDLDLEGQAAGLAGLERRDDGIDGLAGRVVVRDGAVGGRGVGGAGLSGHDEAHEERDAAVAEVLGAPQGGVPVVLGHLEVDVVAGLAVGGGQVLADLVEGRLVEVLLGLVTHDRVPDGVGVGGVDGRDLRPGDGVGLAGGLRLRGALVCGLLLLLLADLGRGLAVSARHGDGAGDERRARRDRVVDGVAVDGVLAVVLPVDGVGELVALGDGRTVAGLDRLGRRDVVGGVADGRGRLVGVGRGAGRVGRRVRGGLAEAEDAVGVGLVLGAASLSDVLDDVACADAGRGGLLLEEAGLGLVLDAHLEGEVCLAAVMGELGDVPGDVGRSLGGLGRGDAGAGARGARDILRALGDGVVDVEARGVAVAVVGDVQRVGDDLAEAHGAAGVGLLRDGDLGVLLDGVRPGVGGVLERAGGVAAGLAPVCLVRDDGAGLGGDLGGHGDAPGLAGLDVVNDPRHRGAVDGRAVGDVGDVIAVVVLLRGDLEAVGQRVAHGACGRGGLAVVGQRDGVGDRVADLDGGACVDGGGLGRHDVGRGLGAVGGDVHDVGAAARVGVLVVAGLGVVARGAHVGAVGDDGRGVVGQLEGDRDLALCVGLDLVGRDPLDVVAAVGLDEDAAVGRGDELHAVRHVVAHLDLGGLVAGVLVRQRVGDGVALGDALPVGGLGQVDRVADVAGEVAVGVALLVGERAEVDRVVVRVLELDVALDERLARVRGAAELLDGVLVVGKGAAPVEGLLALGRGRLAEEPHARGGVELGLVDLAGRLVIGRVVGVGLVRVQAPRGVLAVVAGDGRAGVDDAVLVGHDDVPLAGGLGRDLERDAGHLLLRAVVDLLELDVVAGHEVREGRGNLVAVLVGDVRAAVGALLVSERGVGEVDRHVLLADLDEGMPRGVDDVALGCRRLLELVGAVRQREELVVAVLVGRGRAHDLAHGVGLAEPHDRMQRAVGDLDRGALERGRALGLGLAGLAVELVAVDGRDLVLAVVGRGVRVVVRVVADDVLLEEAAVVLGRLGHDVVAVGVARGDLEVPLPVGVDAIARGRVDLGRLVGAVGQLEQLRVAVLVGLDARDLAAGLDPAGDAVEVVGLLLDVDGGLALVDDLDGRAGERAVALGRVALDVVVGAGDGVHGLELVARLLGVAELVEVGVDLLEAHAAADDRVVAVGRDDGVPVVIGDLDVGDPLLLERVAVGGLGLDDLVPAGGQRVHEGLRAAVIAGRDGRDLAAGLHDAVLVGVGLVGLARDDAVLDAVVLLVEVVPEDDVVVRPVVDRELAAIERAVALRLRRERVVVALDGLDAATHDGVVAARRLAVLVGGRAVEGHDLAIG